MAVFALQLNSYGICSKYSGFFIKAQQRGTGDWLCYKTTDILIIEHYLLILVSHRRPLSRIIGEFFSCIDWLVYKYHMRQRITYSVVRIFIKLCRYIQSPDLHILNIF